MACFYFVNQKRVTMDGLSNIYDPVKVMSTWCKLSVSLSRLISSLDLGIQVAEEPIARLTFISS